jgi:CheY-specific phosphatase CheX
MAESQPVSGARSDIEHSEYIRQSVVSTFSTICGEEPVCSEGNNCNCTGEGMVGKISVVGDVAWSVMLCLPRDVATSLALKFAGFDIPYESADMGDVVGELANVLAGDVVARLDEAGLKADMSLPSVAHGGNVQLLLSIGANCAQMQFDITDGRFWVNLAAGTAS